MIRILAVPNDDGFGPSALLSYLVKELLAAAPKAHVTIWNRFAFDFNCTLYARETAAGRVSVEPVWNRIQLERIRGEVSIERSLQRMASYGSRYQGGADGGFDLVVDFGAPAAARWASERKIRAFTVFDHVWSWTLRMILDDRPATPPALRRRWLTLCRRIEADERLSGRTWLFPRPVTPPVFGSAAAAPGVFRERRRWTRERAAAHLGLSRPGETILVQGGGTAVWQDPLRMLARRLGEAGRLLSRRRMNVVVYAPSSIDFPEGPRVRRLRPVPGGTIQTVLPAVDTAVFRAGGGSVNDAIACRVPFACVREPHQSQIEAILADCETLHLTRAVPMQNFLDDPLDVLLGEHAWLRENKRALRRRMRRIPNTGARDVAAQILASLG